MPFSNETEYPKGFENATLGATFQPTLASSGSANNNSATATGKVSSLVLATSAGVASTFVVRGFGAGPTIMTVIVPAGDTREIRRGFEFSAGIEITGSGGASDFASILYFNA